MWTLGDHLWIEAWDRVSTAVPAACLRPGESSGRPRGHWAYFTFCTSTLIGLNVPLIERIPRVGVRQGFVMAQGTGHVRVHNPKMITETAQIPEEKPGRAYVDPALVSRRARRG